MLATKWLFVTKTKPEPRISAVPGARSHATLCLQIATYGLTPIEVPDIAVSAVRAEHQTRPARTAYNAPLLPG